MSRPKQDVPDPPHGIDPAAKAKRLADCWEDQDKVLIAELDRAIAAETPKPTLVASNDAPIDKGLIGHPKPKLVFSNDLLPEIDWQ